MAPSISRSLFWIMSSEKSFLNLDQLENVLAIEAGMLGEFKSWALSEGIGLKIPRLEGTS